MLAGIFVSVPHTCEKSQRVSDPLGLEQQMVVNHHVGAGNRTQVLWITQCHYPLSHLASR